LTPLLAQPVDPCHLHGGYALYGIFHPSYKHGRRSKDFPAPPTSRERGAAMQVKGLSLDQMAVRLARRRQRLAEGKQGEGGSCLTLVKWVPFPHHADSGGASG
jgi:hypothetical protein